MTANIVDGCGEKGGRARRPYPPGVKRGEKSSGGPNGEQASTSSDVPRGAPHGRPPAGSARRCPRPGRQRPSRRVCGRSDPRACPSRRSASCPDSPPRRGVHEPRPWRSPSGPGRPPGGVRSPGPARRGCAFVRSRGNGSRSRRSACSAPGPAADGSAPAGRTAKFGRSCSWPGPNVDNPGSCAPPRAATTSASYRYSRVR